ncbi:TCR/Tet family MFS transporter [Alphaproteobacteria bacterium KMM 3653]|uniref:TCR/Tet family MFS transporter n=1 Tax=Harenicola maris TaxID=2841044 RepID=A0AAP2CR04_9RHOB|nr:TCR/Tet family MFS transporter [Harenicola maris]
MGSNRAISFILITLVIDAMGIGLIIPVMPDLIRQVTGGDLGQAAIWGGVLTTVFATMQFLFGPLIGSLSDAVGRRPVLLTSLAVLCADYLVMGFAGSIWLLILGRLVGGITSATMSTCNAFIADISKPEEKAARFGLVGAAFGAGFVFGPALGGLLAEWGTRAPFFASAALAFANLCFGYFVLPETVTDKTRRAFQWRRANFLGALQQLRKLPGIGRLLLITMIYEFAFIVYPATWAYFTQERFGWSPGLVGLSLMLFGISLVVVQAGLIRVILRRLGERGTVIYGILFNLSAFVILALLTNPYLALVFTPLTSLGAVVTPALQGMMSRAVADDAQGELQGVIASVKSLAQMSAPLILTQVFFLFTRPEGVIYLPGAAFALSALLMVACGVLFVAKPRVTSARR